jgi:hypothetical protein
MATIAELFGAKPGATEVSEGGPNKPDAWAERWCRFTGRICDVSANRGDRAHLDLGGSQVTKDEAAALRSAYGREPIPLGICTVATQRRYETGIKPWIVCPKRVLELRSVPPILPPEVRALIPIKPGTEVRCWWEFKYCSSESKGNLKGTLEDEEALVTEGDRFFEYTFDYILMPVERGSGNTVKIVGPPYIIEVMTSSTRGGGLTEHMVDALLLKPQRPMRGAVKSPYTPNYRQVFARMASQLFVKAEVAEAWGGRTIWVMQDVLLEYIRQTTDFRPEPFIGRTDGNVFAVIYRLTDAGAEWKLEYDKTLRGPARTTKTADFTGMVGAGYVPPLSHLISVLTKSQGRKRSTDEAVNWIDFRW